MEHTDVDEQTDSGVDTEGVETEGTDNNGDYSEHPMTQSRLFKAIHEINRDTLKCVKELIGKGEDVNLRGVYEETYLHLLCSPITDEQKLRFLPPLVYTLVDAGVDVNAKDREGNTVLHVCAINESPLILVKAFLRAGADPTIVNGYENTAIDFVDDPEYKALMMMYDPGLYKAVETGDKDKVKLMIDHWFNIDIKHNGTKLSKVAKKARHTSVCDLLRANKKQSSLVHAVLSGDEDTVRDTIDSEHVEVDVLDKSSQNADGTQRMWSLVAEAIYTGVSNTAALLLKKVDVNQTVELKNGDLQPLFVWALHAVDSLDSHFIKALLKPADMTLYKADHYQEIYEFWKRGVPSSLLACFVQHGYDLMTRDQEGNTLRDRILLESYSLSLDECKKQLMFVDKCLVRLIRDGATEKLYGFLLKGWDLNVTDHKGNTALEIAKKANKSEVVELLEQAPSITKTIKSLYKAIELGNLQGLRGQLNVKLAESRDCGGRSLLHAAVMFERNFIIQYLLKRHQEILNYTDVLGRSALHYACWLHLVDVEEKLLAAGSDPELKDKLGKTPLDYKQDNKQEAEEERYRRYGVKAQLLNTYLRVSDVIRHHPSDQVALVETQLCGVGVGDLDELQELCPDLEYRKLLFLCVEHRKEHTARALVLAGADMEIAEQVSGSGETSRVVTFLQAAEEAELQGLVSFIKKRLSSAESDLRWQRAAQLNLARIGLDSRMTGPSRGSTAFSRHSWDSVMSRPQTHRGWDSAHTNTHKGGSKPARSASIDIVRENDRYGAENEPRGSTSCTIL